MKVPKSVTSLAISIAIPQTARLGPRRRPAMSATSSALPASVVRGTNGSGTPPAT
jgi:hypothetical protein